MDRAERDASQLKYTGEGAEGGERSLTLLVITNRQEELNKALKRRENPAGGLQHAGMAAAKKDYESTLKSRSRQSQSVSR